MKLSVLVCITNPEERQDIWQESIASMLPWADEVVVVDGTPNTPDRPGHNKIKYVDYVWPCDFSWDELPKHLNAGLKECTGDWTFRADIDYVFKDNWKDGLAELELFKNKRMVTAQKFSTILVDTVYEKGQTQMIINMEHKDTCFGVDEDRYTDLCIPIMKTGMHKGIPKGKTIDDRDIGISHLEFMNYDYCFKTKDFTAKEFLRFSKAHERYFGYTRWGNTEEEALKKFMNMMEGRMIKSNRNMYHMPWQMHPSFIKERVRDIKPEHFGFNGWGSFKK
jgi:hypothetical protein